MHGDFSRWLPAIPKNQVGILAQEGRILLDADVTAQSLLTMRWQDLAARAAFGAGVAAIPADALDGWKVVAASVAGGQVSADVMPGLAWADGLLVELPGAKGTAVTLPATPLGPPIQTMPQGTGADGSRDALVLEVWRRALNGFQVPDQLIEPALGGPDTAERIETAYALRLYRMADGDDCRTIIAKLRDDLASHGKLHATLAPTTMTAGDCPVVQGGGYSGFEHDLYRIEIADIDTGPASFKWSQWNGGLVGSGKIDAAKKLTLRGNDQAIRYSGLSACYVEVVAEQVDGWRVVYGARATLDGEAGVIDLSGPKSFGTLPSSATLVIRVWNDLRAIADFPAGGATELRDGIRLELEASGPFIAGDYWTFAVRAGGIENPGTLLDHAAPFGIHHHRVPLAEIHWAQGIGTLEDCRVPLHPITANDGCCTFSVGDNITSHGNFTKINEAIAALPDKGGRICVLPGEYREAVQLFGKHDVEIVGCGVRSQIIAPADDPAIRIVRSSGIRIEGLRIEAGRGGIGILAETTERLEVCECLVVAGAGSGIEVRSGRAVRIRDNDVQMQDQPSEWAGMTLLVQTARIERNTVEVVDLKGKEYRALGGIWLRGGSVDVDVIDNTVVGGMAHGIILGHAEQAADTSPGVIYALKIKPGLFLGYVLEGLLDGDCVGCGPGTGTVPPIGPTAPTGPGWVAGDPLRGIRIARNKIGAMGMAGIGVFGFFTGADQGVISIYDLEIVGNFIGGCLRRRVADVPDDIADLSGYGAISLADCIEPAIRDNVIEDNGTSASGGVCGIYMMSGTGVEISRNKVVRNGPASPQHISSGTPHGGIWLGFVGKPPTGPGRIACALRGNEVHAPNGPALVIGAYGHVQVIGNALASTSGQGYLGANAVVIEHHAFGSGLTTAMPTVGALAAGRVVKTPETLNVLVGGRAVDDRALSAEEIKNATIHIIPGIFFPRPVGTVMFAQNHVDLTFDNEVKSSMVLVGLSDVDVSGNSFNSAVKSISLPVSITGGTVRVTDNRFAESSSPVWSAQAHGTYAIGTGNISDHCLQITGSTATQVAANIEIHGGACKRLVNFPGAFGVLVGADQ